METKPHVCPVWVGYVLVNPLRKLMENPEKLLAPYINPGMKILEIGPGMGYFSIPMAKMTGKTGKVYCVDIQKKMLSKLNKRAKRKGADNELELYLYVPGSNTLQFLNGQIDFCLLAYVVHEVPDQVKLFSEVADTMTQNGKVLFLEPKGHVDNDAWKESLRIAEKCGFIINESHDSRGSARCALLIKQ